MDLQPIWLAIQSLHGPPRNIPPGVTNIFSHDFERTVDSNDDVQRALFLRELALEIRRD